MYGFTQDQEGFLLKTNIIKKNDKGKPHNVN